MLQSGEVREAHLSSEGVELLLTNLFTDALARPVALFEPLLLGLIRKSSRGTSKRRALDEIVARGETKPGGRGSG